MATNLNIERLAQQKTRITEIHMPPIPDVPASLMKFPGVVEWNRQLKLMRERDQEQLYRALLNKGNGESAVAEKGEKGDKGDTGEQGIQGPPGADGAAGGAPSAATYITQTPHASLSNEQALSLLATGLLKSTTGTGVVSIAAAGTDYQTPLVAGTDYENPLTFLGPLSRAVNTISIPQANGSTDGFLDSADWTTFNNKQDALPVVDTQTIIKGSADATKLLRFEVDGFTTATTRVLTPQNSNYTIAGLEVAQTFTAAQIIAAPDNTISLNIATAVTDGTNTTPFLYIDGEWNTSGTVNAILLDIVDSNHGIASSLVRLQVDGVSVFRIDQTGGTTIGSSGAIVLSGGGSAAFATNQVTIFDTGNTVINGTLTVQSLTGVIVGTAGLLSVTAIAQGDLFYGSATGVLSALAKNTTATRYLSNTGSSNNPAWAQIDLTNGVTGILPAANGGTGATAFTAGSIVFAGTSGVYTQDNANFFWDDTNNKIYLGGATVGAADTILAADGSAIFNEQGSAVDFRVETDTKTHMLFVQGSTNRIGINTSAPTQMFELWGVQNTSNRFLMFDDVNWIRFQFQSSHASIGLIWNLTSGKDWYMGETADTGTWIFRGRNFTNEGSMSIGTTAITAKLSVIKTSEQLRIGYDASNYYSTTVGSTGGVTFDAVGAGARFTFSDGVTFNAPARLKGYTVATLPAGTQGDYAFVTDSLAPAFLTAVVGGGAVVTPVFYDGTNWVAA